MATIRTYRVRRPRRDGGFWSYEEEVNDGVSRTLKRAVSRDPMNAISIAKASAGLVLREIESK